MTLAHKNLRWKVFRVSRPDVDCNAGRIAVVITVPVLKTQEPAHGEENEDLGGTSTTIYATLALGEASIPLAILETSSRAAALHREFVRGEEHRSDAARRKSETGHKKWS